MSRKQTLAWDSRGLVATDLATGTVYDLTKGVNRIPVARHIMRLLPRNMSIQQLLKKAKISRTYELWFQVIEEKGEELIEAYQIISIAKALGLSDGEILNGAYAPQDQPVARVVIPILDSPDNIHVPEAPAPKHEPCEAQAYADGPEPLWKTDDCRGLFPDGKAFDLRAQDVRCEVCKRIKARNPYASIDELFRQRNVSWMQAKWFSRVSNGLAPIHGSQLEAIAGVVDASLYWLVFGEYGTLKTTVEEVSVPIADEPTTAVKSEALVEVPQEELLPAALPEPQVLIVQPSAPVMHAARASVLVTVIEPAIPEEEPPAKVELDIFVPDVIAEPEARVADTEPVEAQEPEEPLPVAQPEEVPAPEALEEVIPDTTETVVEEAASGVPEEITWDKAGHVATYKAVTYDLGDKELRATLADRIRFAKGAMTYSELIAKAKLTKRNAAWLSTLTVLSKRELGAIAKACQLPIESLLSGDGVLSRSAGESATACLQRYEATMPDGTSVVSLAKELARELGSLPPATRHMVIEHLAESTGS